MLTHTPLQKPIVKGATILVEMNVSSKENARFLLLDRFEFSDDPFVGLNTRFEISEWPSFPQHTYDFSSYDPVDTKLIKD